MQLTNRERTFVIGGLCFLALLAVLQFVVRPTAERAAMIRRVVIDKRDVLAQLRSKHTEYQKLKEEVDRLRSMIPDRAERGKMLTAVERIRETCGLSENMLSVKPTTMTMDDEYEETVVEVNLDGVTLAELVEFLAKLESLKLAGGIRALEVRRADQRQEALRAVVQLANVSYIRSTD